MNIAGIRLFILSAKYLNITQAAREVHTSQSAASRQLKLLQADIGLKLLMKNRRGIALTKSGRAYLNEVSPIFSQLETLHKKYMRTHESLTIACSHDVSTRLMPSVMTQC